MKRKAFYLIVGLCIVLCSACEKDKFSPPVIQTLSMVAQSPTSVTVVGSISDLGTEKIEDYGFIYNHFPVVDENNGVKVSLGNSPQKGEFGKHIDNIKFTNNSSYYSTLWARAYLKDTKGTAFGAVVSVTLPNPTASDIVPSSGMSGDIVKIKGKFYAPTIDNTQVLFHSTRAKIISVSDTEIVVEVPSGINVYHGYNMAVNVSIGGIPSNNNSAFKILANFKDFSPKSGPVGTLVSFTGDNLPEYYYYNSDISIQLGNIVFTSVSNNRMNVPFTVGETSEVSTTVGGKKKALPGVFKVTPPQITSTNIETVFPGQNILVYGSNFPPVSDVSAGRPMIKLGTGDYVVASWNSSGNQFTYTVPVTTAEGEYTLYLKIGPHEVQAPKKIKVLGYAATSFEPTSGSPGQEVNISGVFSQGSGYYVSFGTGRVYGTASSSTNLKVKVPTGINAGKIKLTVEVPNKTITIPGEFEILGPSFTSFSPASGVPGTLITIKGSGFNPTIQGTIVKFGTISVTPSSVTDDTIVVAVPSNVAAGAMKLTVVTYGQSVVHNDNFTLLNQ